MEHAPPSHPTEPPATAQMLLAEFDALIADYVARRLPEHVQLRFEEAMLARPEWAERVEAEHRLREGIRALAGQDPELFE